MVDEVATDIEFNLMVVQCLFLFNQRGRCIRKEYIYQFSLGKNYDVSTATHIGSIVGAIFGRRTNGFGSRRIYFF